MSGEKLNIILAGGGTGGHIFPAIALAEALQVAIKNNEKYESANILFLGSDYGLETTMIPEAGYDLETLPIRGIIRSFSIINIYKNLQLPLRILFSIINMNKIIQSFRPHVVIGTGGYASAIPIRQAIKAGIPVFLQEQNSYPGLTTRLFAHAAKHVFITYDDAKKHLKTEQVSNYGNPVRSSLVKSPRIEVYNKFALNPKRKTLFIFGGSQGAHAINLFLIKYIRKFAYYLDIQILWQTGKKDYDACEIAASQSLNITVQPFIQDMGAAFSMADLVMSRAGAMALTEITSFGLPSILIPLPSATANHQYHNAQSLEKNDAAIIIKESELDYESMLNLLKDFFNNPDKLNEMGAKAKQMAKPNAANNIVQTILEKIS